MTPQRLDLHKALDQPQHRGRDQDRARHGHLLHARRQVRRLPYRHVVHMQVAADRPHHHLTSVQPERACGGAPLRALHLSGLLLRLPACARRRSRPAPHGSSCASGALNNAMMPSPITWLTVPSYRCTAAIMGRAPDPAGAVLPQGHGRPGSSIEPLRSAKSTVTCLRSPSRAPREVRIFSARYGGV